MSDYLSSGSQPPVTRRSPRTVSRRAALGAVGVGVAGLAAGGGLYASADNEGGGAAAGTISGPRLSVAQWRRQRGITYLIAHRGSGDVYPEHSFPAYDAALAWGAQAMEVSVQKTSDGVLICMHDDTYDRTTTIKGSVAGQSSSVLNLARLTAVPLGPAWASPTLTNLLRIPRLEDVLRRYGGRMVLCLDAKDPSAFAPMVKMIEKLGLKDTVIAKVYAGSSNIAAAQKLELPVFGYYGTSVSTADIKKLADRLNPARDYLVVTPADSDATDADVAAVRAAVATGVPTWVGPLHRRFEVDRYFVAGAVGAVCASYGYQSSRVALATEDAWVSRAVVSGELTQTPGTNRNVPRWTGSQDLTLSLKNTKQFITLGNLSPVASNIYTITFDLRWNVLPDDPTAYVSFAFGHVDDRYYESRSGAGIGFHGILRANGTLELLSHDEGEENGTRLGKPLDTPPLPEGIWATLRLDVTPTTLRWSRTDGKAPITIAADAQIKGGYLHIGRSSNDSKASMSLRNLIVNS